MGALVQTAKRKLNNAIARGEMASLPEWAVEYAQWRAQQTKRVPFKTIMVEAQLRSPVPLAEREVRNVLASKPYAKFFDWCMSDVGAAARYKFNRLMLKAVDLHGDAMSWARDDKNYGAVPALTNPVFDRMMPRRTEAPQVQANIQINLTPRQAAVLAAESVEMESAEIAEVETE